MIAEDCSIVRLIRQTQAQVCRVYAKFHCLSESLAVFQNGGDEDAEDGWRPYWN